MNRKILFTPVGGTDPISSTNCYDGAILHICRHYKPDKVIMYMSKEMLENQEKAHQKLVNETAAKMLEHQVKKLGNINVNGERQTPISLENNQDEVSKMAEYFFSQT